MKTIYTSYYAVANRLPSELNPIGISVGKCKYLPDLKYDFRLAPTFGMLKMTREQYDKLMYDRLSKLDAKAVFDSLPKNAVLLCYEKYNDWCHRRMVAEWFEQELGIEVTEYGLTRAECFPYAELGPQTKGKKRQPELHSSRISDDRDDSRGNIPESVKKRLESYREPPNMNLFNYMDWEGEK